MKNHILEIATGSAGIAATEAVSSIPPESINQIGQLIIQVAIGIATIIQLLRKKNQKAVEK